VVADLDLHVPNVDQLLDDVVDGRHGWRLIEKLHFAEHKRSTSGTFSRFVVAMQPSAEAVTPPRSAFRRFASFRTSLVSLGETTPILWLCSAAEFLVPSPAMTIINPSAYKPDQKSPPKTPLLASTRRRVVRSKAIPIGLGQALDHSPHSPAARPSS
jgi:hypothetical protein